MIFLYRARLVILSQPKTGTTALERALAQRAAMALNGPPEMKHISYRGFMKTVAPMLESQAGMKRGDYFVVATMREPIDWLGSWYRYRTREKLTKSDNPRSTNYTGSISFDEFVREVCASGDDKPAYARVKTPSWVSLAHTDCVGVDRLFPYEDSKGLLDLIRERSGRPVEPEQRNVSPRMEISLTPETTALVREKFAFDFDLHASLQRDGMVEDRFRAWHDDGTEEDYSPGV